MPLPVLPRCGIDWLDNAALRCKIAAFRQDAARRPSNMTRRDPMATQPLRTQVKKQLDDVTSEVTKSAHQVFLAGLGAAALSQEEGGRLFDRLVTRGRKVETEGKKKVNQTRSRGKKQLDAAKKRATGAFERVQGE